MTPASDERAASGERAGTDVLRGSAASARVGRARVGHARASLGPAGRAQVGRARASLGPAGRARVGRARASLGPAGRAQVGRARANLGPAGRARVGRVRASLGPAGLARASRARILPALAFPAKACLALACLALALGACAPPWLPARPLAGGGAPTVRAGVEHRSGVFRGAGGAMLVEQSWRPVGRAPRAVLVIHHGLKDHSSRYGDLARRLVARGYAVHAYDMRGHGHSSGRRAALDDFEDLVRDLDIFMARVRRREPGLPVFLMGHSVGGAVVTLYTLERRPALAGLIVLAPALRVDKPPIAAAATPVAGALLPNLPVVDTPDELFSRSPSVRREMARDPLVYHRVGPARTAAALTAALARIWPRAGELDVPLLGVHGTADQLTSPRGTAELVRRARTRDRTLILYAGLYHDLVHEPEREQVMADIERWLDIRTSTVRETSIRRTGGPRCPTCPGRRISSSWGVLRSQPSSSSPSPATSSRRRSPTPPRPGCRWPASPFPCRGSWP